MMVKYGHGSEEVLAEAQKPPLLDAPHLLYVFKHYNRRESTVCWIATLGSTAVLPRPPTLIQVSFKDEDTT